MRSDYIFVFSFLLFLNGYYCVQWESKERNDWRPVNHWRNTASRKYDVGQSNSNRRSFDKNGINDSNPIPQKTSNEYRIEWYSKLCRKTGKYCDQLKKAKGYAMRDYKRKLKKIKNVSKLQQSLVKNIRRKNPHLNKALANNTKDYIMHRMKQDKQKYIKY